ncbi:MAG: HD domain-containing protein [Bacteroidota bacterium]
MTQSPEKLIEATKTFVKETLSDAEGGHDWFHTQRVYRLASRLAKEEKADEVVVQLAALLHDIADAKFHNGDETLGPKIAAGFLAEMQVDEAIITHVFDIIRYMSFKNSLDGASPFDSKELRVVQDADRLDAIGAIGIARTFNYGGFKNRSMYNPNVPPNLNMSKAEYKKSNAPTINHFYEKLLLLKDQMHTATAKKIAAKRHDYMLSFLDQFYAEWDSKD